MATAKKLPSGTWRVRVYSGKNEQGNACYKSFTAATKKEAEYLATEYLLKANGEKNKTLGSLIDAYIKERENVLSPTTIQGYQKIRENYFLKLMDIPVSKITNEMLQAAINSESAANSPKTVANAYGLVNTVLRKNSYKTFDVRLPSKVKHIKTLPDPQDIIKVVTDTEIELPVLLAMWLSLRMSEVLGIKKSDIKDDILTINRVRVLVGKEYVTKDAAKNYTSKRILRVPPYIMSLIKKVPDDQEFLISLSGRAIYARLERLLKSNSIPHISFHDLRHVNASVMMLLGVPDKYAMERGGWSTDYVLKNTYQHTFTKEREIVDKRIDDYFENCLKNI